MNYLEKVQVSGVDELGIKELFDDFIGEFIAVHDGKYLVSDGAVIRSVHPSQVSRLSAKKE